MKKGGADVPILVLMVAGQFITEGTEGNHEQP
jgi:hypothetical protein